MLVVVGLVLWALLQAPPLRRAWQRRTRDRRVATLRRRYLRRLQMPLGEAEITLARQLADLEVRFPGKSPVWRLRKLLGEIERARR